MNAMPSSRLASFQASLAVPGAPGFVAAVRDLDEQLPDVDLRLFLITNRVAALEAATIANLRAVGIEIDPDSVLCLGERADWDRDKAGRRAYVASLGYRIAMIVGDDFNDLRPARGLSRAQRVELAHRYRDLLDRGLWILVPNPMYGSWMPAAAEGADPGLGILRQLAWGLDANLPDDAVTP